MSASPSTIDLDATARDFADEVRSIARAADNEEELRIEMAALIRDLAEELGLNIDPEHERTLVSSRARPDSVYGDVVIEFKDPNRRNWASEAMEGRGEGDSGLIDYMYDLARERSHDEDEQRAALDRMVGVGTNGYEIIFCRYRPDTQIEVISSGQTHLPGLERADVAEEVEIVEKHRFEEGARRFLMYLRSLQRKPLSSQQLAESFGGSSDTARTLVNLLYDELIEHLDSDDRISMLYQEWERVFGIVYGEELDQIREDREEFGVVYGMEDPDVRPLLFSVHTYYALFMKVLVRELVASISETGLREAELNEPNNDELQRKLREIEDGKEFRLVGLEDFFEEGFFGWYLDAWDDNLADAVRDMVQELGDFEAATPTLKPEAVRDILKDLYQDLVPQVIRHDLGEYLTPDWLAEYTVDAAGYDGEGRVLDPACGSGTFLIEAIQRIRKSSENESEDLLEEILGNVVGFDLNPIAVIASRTNYLMGLGELAFTGPAVRIPVYQCDSILTPSKYIDWFGGGEEAFEIVTTEQPFKVPAFEEQDDFEALFSLIDDYVGMGATPDEFEAVADDELELSDHELSIASELYGDIKELDDQNHNGIWAQLLRNRIAPEFVGEFEYVIGNPPWVDWANLSQEYRDISEDVWEEYKLFEFSGYDARTVHDDICILMTYVALDEYLVSDGRLGFILPQQLFQSHQGGYGFRRFSIPKRNEDGGIDYHPFEIDGVDDLSGFNPFDASNRTAVVGIQKGEETSYPVPYKIWKHKDSIQSDDTLTEVLSKVEFIDVVAEPVQAGDQQSEWLTLKKGAISAIRNVMGESDLVSREGVNTLGADGIYHVDLVEDKGDSVIIENLPEEGRQRSIRNRGQIRREVEKELLYPIVKGRHIGPWRSEIEYHLIFPHENKRGPHNAIPEEKMRKEFPKGYQFFQEWEDILIETRERNSKFYDEDTDPFYLLDNVGEYTFAPYKAVWQRVARTTRSAVLEPIEAGLGTEKPVLNYDKVMAVGFDERDPAHFTSALLNSVFTRLVTRAYTNALSGLSTHVLENVDIPEYDSGNEIHQEIASLSKEAHETQDDHRINEIESELNELARQLWDVSKAELEEVQESLIELDS